MKNLTSVDSSGAPIGGSPTTFVHNYLQELNLSFRDFMELALYHPTDGYYASGKNPIGKDSDYVTSTAISPAFAFGLARLAGEFVDRSGDGLCGFVDAGCGDGRLLSLLMDELPPEVRERLVFYGVDRTLSRVDPALRDRSIQFVTDFDELPADVPLLVIANELFDAMPFARLVSRAEELHELWITLQDGHLEWTEQEATDAYVAYFRLRGIALADDQFADVSLDWGTTYERLANRVARGLIVTFDYGYEAEKLFDARHRRWGTAAAYSRHQVSRDLLARPGEQDLTAHINFSDLIAAGETTGFETLSFTRQAPFLLSLGITEHQAFQPADQMQVVHLHEAVDEIEERGAARRLVLPDGIGEEMRVLVQSKNLPDGTWSFQRSLYEET